MDKINLLKLTKSFTGQTDINSLIKSSIILEEYLSGNTTDTLNDNNDIDDLKKLAGINTIPLIKKKETYNEYALKIIDESYNNKDILSLNMFNNTIYSYSDIIKNQKYIFNYILAKCFTSGTNCLIIANGDDRKIFKDIANDHIKRLGSDVIISSMDYELSAIYVDEEGNTKSTKISIITENQFKKSTILEDLQERIYDYIVINRADKISFSDTDKIIDSIYKISTSKTKLISFIQYIKPDTIETISDKSFLKKMILDGCQIIFDKE